MDLSVLNALCDLNGVSGNEALVSNYIFENFNMYADEIYKDNMGNLIFYKNAKVKSDKTVMLCAHMDEVGLIVSSVTDDGYVKFRTVGGIDSGVLLGKKVLIGNKTPGVIGIKAIHLTSKDDRRKKVSSSEMYIDIGANSKDEALLNVNIGDYIAFVTRTEILGNLLKGKAFDDRVGCFILTELMKTDFECNVIFCFNVQEEIGLRGAAVSSKNQKIDYCLVVEGTTCLDFPGLNEDRICTKLGFGVAVTIADKSTFPSSELRNEILTASKKYQFKNTCSGGNDAGIIHLNNIKTEALSVPARYIHSPVSVINLEDVKSCIDTICNLIGGFDND